MASSCTCRRSSKLPKLCWRAADPAETALAGACVLASQGKRVHGLPDRVDGSAGGFSCRGRQGLLGLVAVLLTLLEEKLAAQAPDTLIKVLVISVPRAGAMAAAARRIVCSEAP